MLRKSQPACLPLISSSKPCISMLTLLSTICMWRAKISQKPLLTGMPTRSSPSSPPMAPPTPWPSSRSSGPNKTTTLSSSTPTTQSTILPALTKCLSLAGFSTPLLTYPISKLEFSLAMPHHYSYFLIINTQVLFSSTIPWAALSFTKAILLSLQSISPFSSLGLSLQGFYSLNICLKLWPLSLSPLISATSFLTFWHLKWEPSSYIQPT